MRNETRENFGSVTPLTFAALQQLEGKGFRFVQVKGFASDKHQDYMDPRYLVLVPIKDLPEDPNKKEIYEPINSPLLLNWINYPLEGVEILIAC